MTPLREAAQQALEAYAGGPNWRAFADSMDALKAALAEPVQEPVAWQWLDTAHFRKKIPADATPSEWRPLYTAPLQRKPLTEEEIGRICAPLGFAQLSPVEVARAIERAHGIGGSNE